MKVIKLFSAVVAMACTAFALSASAGTTLADTMLADHLANGTATSSSALAAKITTTSQSSGTCDVTQWSWCAPNPASFGDPSTTSGSLGPNGWTKLDNGLILQWGTTYVPANACAGFVFPKTFTSQVFSVTSAPIGNSAGGGNQDFWGVQAVTTYSMQVCSKYDSGRTAYIYAVGT